MAKRGKKGGLKYYAVAVGRTPGIYTTWPECQAQTSGYSGAIFKSFEIMQEAQSFIRLNDPSSFTSTSSTSSFIPASAARATVTATAEAHDVINRGTKRPHPDAFGTADLHQHAGQSRVPATTATAVAKTKATSPNQQQNNHRILRIIIHFDGGSRGNPGVAGAGAHVLVEEEEEGHIRNHYDPTNAAAAVSEKKITKEYHVRKYCGVNATNNYAEYSGLLAGLEVAKACVVNLCKKNSFKAKIDLPYIHLEIYGDSNLIIQQMRGVWKCTHANISPLFNQCNALIREMNECIAVDDTEGVPTTLYGEERRVAPTFGHIRRNLNVVADALANEAMDARRSWTSTITASATSSQAIEAGIHNEMKPMMPSTRWGSNGLIEETGGVIATPSSKRKVINAEESSNDSDGNESYYSC